jgi:hypothetical protein
MSAVFRTAPDRQVAELADWIAGGDSDYTPAELIAELLPEPAPHWLEALPWLRAAWEGPPAARVAARLWCTVRLGDWHDGDVEDPAPLWRWARQYAEMLRQTLFEAAGPNEALELLGTLADVLGQNLSETAAAFIVEQLEAAELPRYVLRAVFANVARRETGKIKPASFTRLLAVAQERLRLVTRPRDIEDLKQFVRDIEAGLAWLSDHLADARRAEAANSDDNPENLALGGFLEPVR